jgi:hypothetical protein
MSRRLLQLGLFMLAVACPQAAGAATFPEPTSYPALVAKSRSIPASPDDKEQLDRLKAAHPQARVELRQSGVEVWLAPAARAAVELPPAWVARPGLPPPTPLRLHLLHCAWLN